MSFDPVRLLLIFLIFVGKTSIFFQQEGKDLLLSFTDIHAVLWRHSSFSVSKP